MYQVALDVYKGPLDVLLRLIERQELDITLVSLALVADQFLEHISRLQEESAANLADFLVIAARLLVLKSRILLPKPEEQKESEGEDWEQELVERLREYKRFKQVAAQLREIEEEGQRAYPRIAPPPKITPRLVAGELEVADLVAAFKRVLEAHPPMPPVDDVVAPLVVHITDCIANILWRVRRYPRVRFSTLIKRARSRVEIIVTFMALLELLKQQRIRAMQEQPFGEIHIEAREPGPGAEIAPIDLYEYGEQP